MAYLAILPKAPANYDPVRATAEGARPAQLRAPGDGPRTATSPRPSAHAAAADAARHDPLRQQREVPPAGRLFHGGSPPRPDRAVRREGRGRPEQRLCRRPVGAHLDGPGDAGRRREGAARRPGPLRRRPRLARPGPERSTSPSDWARPARSRAGRHRLPRLAEGGRACRRTAAQATIGFADGSTGTLPASARVDAEARRRRSGVRRAAPGHGHHRQAGRGRAAMRCARSPRSRGGMVVEEVHTGRVLAMQGGFDVRRLQLQPRHPGAAPAGLDLQADRLCRRRSRTA